MVERTGLMLPESRAASMELGYQDPYSEFLRDPSRLSGLGGLGASTAGPDFGVEQLSQLPAPDYGTLRRPQEPSGPSVYFDQGRNLFSINGYTFDAEDYNAAVGSRQYLGGASKPPPDAGSWSRLSPSVYEQYMQTIEEPTLGTRFGRSFDIGVQNLKTLGGAGLQFLGAEETGAGVVNRASEELQRLSPFQVSASEVASGELGAIEYAVSVLGQQGPNILESIGTALVGAAAGGVASGNPVGAAVGSFGAMLSKGAIKGAAKEAAKAYARGAASAEQKKLLARIGGAAAATAVNNYAMGVSDIYSETRQQGAGPENMDARAVSAALGIPYAVLSTIPEAIAAGRLFGFSNAAGGLLRRVGTGAAVGAGLEGATEVGQEALVMAGGQQFGGDYTDEYLARLIEAGVAGAVVGGGIGGVVNLRAGKPTDILQGRQTPPPATPTAAPELPASPEEIAAQQAQLDAMGVPTVQPGATPSMETGAGLNTAGLPVLSGSDTGPLGPRVGELSPEDQALASSWASQVLPPAAPVQPIAVQRTDLPPGMAQPRPRTRPTPPDFVAGTEPVQPIAAQRTDLPPGMQRLRQRPSERAETYAPTPAPASETAMGEQLMALQQQQQAAQAQAQAAQVSTAREAEFEAAQEQAAQQREEELLRARDNLDVDADVAWEQFRPGVRETEVTFEVLTDAAQRQWAEAARTGAADKKLYNALKTRTDPKKVRRRKAQADELKAARNTLAQRGRLSELSMRMFDAQERTLTNELQRRRQATEEPTIVTPAPKATARDKARNRALTMATTNNTAVAVEGRPYKDNPTDPPIHEVALPDGTLVRIAKTTDMGVTDWVNIDTGANLFVDTKPEAVKKLGEPFQSPPKPPKPEKGADDAVRKQGTKESTLRQGPKAGGKVRGRDTKGQTPTGEGAAQTEGETQAKGAAQEPTPAREAEVTPSSVDLTEGDAVVVQNWFAENYPASSINDFAPSEAEQRAAQALQQAQAEYDQRFGIRPDEVGPPHRRKPSSQWGGYDLMAAEKSANPAEATAAKKIRAAEIALQKPRARRLDDTGFIRSALRSILSDLDPAVLEDPFPILQAALSDTRVPRIEEGFRPQQTTQEQQPVKPAKPKKVKLPAEETDAELDAAIAMDAVIKAEDVILNDARKKRTLLTQAELDAGVELTVLSTNSDPAVAKAALDVLELNLPRPQYKELAGYVERANNHGSLGGNRADADFAAKELQTMVTMFNSGAVPDNSAAAFQVRFRELAARVRKSDPNADVLGYATVSNLPNKKAGQIAHTTPNTKPGGAFSLASLADVVLGNGKRAVPLAIGKQRMIARNILNKFKVKPELSVFANQADMKQRNPALYKRAAAARSQGDFDSAPAVGYFFDNQVIIFSDRVATRQQLEFVVAHEVLGHFGMRAVLGASEFNALMESFYNDSVPYMKIAVDDMVAARGIPRAEAVEEYLSDFAARVEMSVLRRWWAKVKDALNKIGFKFDDDAARYLMNQSRRYLRTGEKGSVFNTDRVAGTMHQLDAGTDPSGVGRFSTAAKHITVRSVGHTVDDPGRLMPSSIQDAQDKFTRAVEVLGFAPKDLADKYDALKRNLVTPAIFRGMRSEGLQLVYENLTRATNTARSLVTRMQTMRDIALNPRAELLATVGMGGSGISLDERAKAGYMLKANRMYHSHNYRMPSMRNLPKLFLRNAATGKLELQDGPNGAFTKLLKGNRLSREAWAKGVRVPYDTQLTMTDAKRAELEAERDAAVAAATTEKAKNRIKRDYKARIEANTYTGVEYLDVKQEFTDLEWGAFNQELDAMGYTAVELLESILTKHDQERTNSYRRVEKQLDAAMTDGDRALLDRVARRYVEIQDANLTILEGGQIDPSSRDTAAAEKFLIQFNAALLGTGRDRIYNLFAPNADNDGIVAFPDSERQELTDMIDGFLTRYRPPAADSNAVESIEKRRVVQREVGLIAGQLSTSHDAEKAAVRSLQTGYVPIVRTGTHQASMVFTGTDGKRYTLGESYREQAPYMQYESRSDADRAAKELTALFGDKEFTVEVWDPEADNGRGKLVMKTGKLSGVSSVALDAPTTDPEISHDAALRFIRRFNIPLTPQKLEEIVKASTTSGNRAILRQLKTGFTPGAPNDLTSAISAHIESRAATIARNKTSVELENILDIKGESAELWTGSKKRYDALKAEYERLKAAPNPDEDAISVARQKFEQYHRWYVTENAPSDGNKFYAEARSMVAFRDQQKGVLETDLANNKHIALVQMLTSVSYLGFMMASGALNVISGFVNSPAALGTVNHETGFGGGFGMAPAYAAMVRMTKVAAGLGGQKDTAEYWQKLTPAQLKEMGIEPETRDFIAVGINSGILQAAQTNSLMGSARGRITSGGMQKFLTAYMAPFNWTEQVGRRTTALAGFELMFQRHLAAGKSRAEAAEAASSFATQMVLSTLGGYTAIDRPALFRGGPLQFAFMFSMFTVNTAALIANLPWSGRVALLGSLLLISGLRGVPYAEDIEDLVNTLAQKFGIPMPSVRDSLRRAGDEFIPGFGEMLISGAANRFLPYDIGSRFSSGDIIPGTGIGLAGADVSRELISIGGPMASWTQQMIGTIGNVADILPGGKAFSVEKTLRASPVAFVRAVADAYAFDKHGAIVDKRGYVVSEDYNAAVGLGRILGLQPNTTSAAYGAIREAKLITEYQKSMSVYYRDRIVAATVAGDNAKVQALYAEARDWNESAEGTGLEVVNLRSRVRSALRSQRLGATERFLKTTALSSRSAAQQIVDAYIAE